MRPTEFSTIPLVLLTNALFSAVRAQNFNATSVPLNTRTAWCRSQIQTCPEICLSAGTNVDSSENACDFNTIAYTCSCLNGFTPDMARYTNTIPYFVCQQVTSQCVAAHPNDVSGQKTCLNEQTTFCFNSNGTVTSIYHVTTTQGSGSVSTSDITLTVVGEAPGTSTTANSNSTSTTNANSTSTGTQGTRNATSPASTPSSSPPARSGLTGGTLIAAIVVPIVVVILLVVLGVGFWRRKKSKDRQVSGNQADNQQGEQWVKAELPSESRPPVELPVDQIHELPGEWEVGELEGRGHNAE